MSSGQSVVSTEAERSEAERRDLSSTICGLVLREGPSAPRLRAPVGPTRQVDQKIHRALPRRTGADRGCEASGGIRSTGKWTDDRQVEARLAVGLDLRAALLRRAGDTGCVDHRVAHQALGALAVAALPGFGDRRRLFGKAMLGHHAIVARAESEIDGGPRAQRR